MSKLYISSSKQSSPQDYSFVKDLLSKTTHFDIKEYTGGNFNVTDTDECEVIVIIPPANSKSNTDDIYIGRGQYDITVRALDQNQTVIVYFDKEFHHVGSEEYIGENWQNEYGILFTTMRTCAFNKCIEEREKVLENKKKMKVTKNCLLPAYILFPNRFN